MCVDLYSTIFIVNKKNHLSLSQEFNFTDKEDLYIHLTFWPIIEVKTFEISEISKFLIDLKKEFITSNKTFNLKIFKRQRLDVFEHYLETYLDCLEREKYKIWDFKKDKYFYHLKLEGERNTPRHQTLLISDKDPTQLEIYFIQVLDEIKKLINTPTKEASNKTDFYSSKENESKEPLKLINLFEHTSKYTKIMDILVSKKLIHENTFLYNKANKKELASLTKHLHSKGYYKDNILPDAKIIFEIIKQQFGIEVGMSTIEHSKATDFMFKYIPYASEIE